MPRLLVAVLLAFLPIYLANIAFAKRFSDSGDSRAAFAVNILGAIVGGCLEYAALLTGYANLLLVVAALYLHRVPAEAARARRSLGSHGSVSADRDVMTWGACVRPPADPLGSLHAREPPYRPVSLLPSSSRSVC